MTGTLDLVNAALGQLGRSKETTAAEVRMQNQEMQRRLDRIINPPLVAPKFYEARLYEADNTMPVGGPNVSQEFLEAYIRAQNDVDIQLKWDMVDRPEIDAVVCVFTAIDTNGKPWKLCIQRARNEQLPMSEMLEMAQVQFKAKAREENITFG